jgi:cAMP-dependent protein kinase regulator
MRKQLLSAMSLETHDPGSLIVEEGELGDDIYFIVEGELTVVGVDDKKSYPKLGPGDYFGYLSIVLKERRTASVRAETYCDLMRLHGKDYDTIKEAYPEIKEVLKQAASANTEKMSELILLGAVL